MKPPGPALRKWIIGIVVALLVLVALAFAFESQLNSWARGKVIADLKTRFAADADFGSLEVTVLPRVRVTAKDVVLRYNGRRDIPPLLQIGSLTASSGLLNLLREHVSEVQIDDLQIHIPPHEQRTQTDSSRHSKEPVSHIVIDQVTTNRVHLAILPGDPGKQALPFEIHDLRMGPVAMDRPAQFHATLTNPRPRGEIDTGGSFGPWQRDDPGETALAASYKFTHADLASFNGLAGMLSSQGKFGGKLDHIEADGETQTPDFMLRISGHPVDLRTKFHALIDGTNGDTMLQPVHAQFLNSEVEAQGGITGKPDLKGKTVALDVVVSKGRIEDMLRLALKGASPMTGNVAFHTKLVVPPGDIDVAQKLQLDGEFGVTSAKFTQLNVSEKVKDLSRRAEGQPENQAAGSAISNLHGKFVLRDGVIHFTGLTFSIEGASLQLDGSFGLNDEKLDFHGIAQIDAKISQTVTGFKSFLLKAIDPFFKKKGGGSQVAIRILGTRDHPIFGLDIGHKH